MRDSAEIIYEAICLELFSFVFTNFMKTVAVKAIVIWMHNWIREDCSLNYWDWSRVSEWVSEQVKEKVNCEDENSATDAEIKNRDRVGGMSAKSVLKMSYQY